MDTTPNIFSNQLECSTNSSGADSDMVTNNELNTSSSAIANKNSFTSTDVQSSHRALIDALSKDICVHVMSNEFIRLHLETFLFALNNRDKHFMKKSEFLSVKSALIWGCKFMSSKYT
jgi:hypothetical protein